MGLAGLPPEAAQCQLQGTPAAVDQDGLAPELPFQVSREFGSGIPGRPDECCPDYGAELSRAPGYSADWNLVENSHGILCSAAERAFSPALPELLLRQQRVNQELGCPVQNHVLSVFTPHRPGPGYTATDLGMGRRYIMPRHQVPVD